MTEGKIFKSIIIYAIPLILGNFMQQLYSTVDSFVVGNYVGATALAAVGASGQLIFFLIAFCLGASAGGGILISQFYGAKSHEELHHVIHNMLGIAVVLGVVSTVAGIVFCPQLLRAMGTPEDMMPEAVLYLRIYFMGMIFMTFYNMLAAILNAVGNSAKSLEYLVISSLINIILDFVLICGFHMGVEGAAISTAFSRGVSMVLLFIILFRKHIHRFPIAYFRPFPWIELKNLMKVGLPSAGEQLSYSSSQVVITFFINMLGVEALATRTYCVNIIMFAYLFSISMAQGGAICIGHLIGEKKPHAAFLMGKYVMKKSVMITVILSTILAIFGNTIFHWLTTNEEIIRLGTTILIIDVILEIGRPINIFATNALRAAGDVTYPFYVGLVVQWSVAVGLGYIIGIPLEWGICGMWVAFLLDENIRGAIFVKRWYSMKWTTKGFVK